MWFIGCLLKQIFKPLEIHLLLIQKVAQVMQTFQSSID